MPLIVFGTNTSKRPVWSASTIASATSSGSTALNPRVSGSPEPSSVLTTTGITTLTSMSVPRSSGADRLAQADDGVLGRAVGGAAREPGLAGRRGDLDEMAAAAGQEPLERELGAVDDPVQVDVDHPLGGRVGLLDERADGHDPGVVDQHVERPERALGLVA